MKINHTVTQYAIGLGALALATNANVSPAPVSTDPAAIHAAQKPSRFDWPVLGQDKTIALGEEIARSRPVKITVYCSTTTCNSLARDLDDAFQIADVPSTLESRQVDSEQDEGVFVGPPGDAAEFVVASLKKATGIDATIVGITDEKGKNIEGVGVIIGKLKK